MRKIFFLTNILLLLGLTGCLDRDFRYGDDEIGEGFADLRLTASFENLAPALDSRAPGNSVHDIDPEQLWVVLYRQLPDGTFEYHDHKRAKELPSFSINQTGNTAEPSYPDRPSGTYEPSVEGATPSASFDMNDIPYGRYRIYAVANVPSLTREQCETEETLKKMTFEWKTNVGENNAMFGYFTPSTDQSASGFQSETPLVISRASVDLHCWVKRLVSKVTIAFDPSELKEFVTVYIKKVTIRDIPKSCKLGEDNCPTEKELISVGESINYYTAETESDYNKWGIILKKGSGKKGSVNHTNSDPALFFFENMQGDYEGDKNYLKEQIPDETGTPIDAEGDNQYGEGTNDFKDRVKAGTWVEVEGYYVSNNPEKMSSGKIIYRFMLGKNTTYNYDAQRNYHYKLTLKLRGFANEADWHISYKEQPITVYTPEPYFNVSYLYGQEHTFPVRLVAGGNEEQYVLKVEITQNGWWPTDNRGNRPGQTVGDLWNVNGFAWNTYSFAHVYTEDNSDYAGFLSMRKPTDRDLFSNIGYADTEKYLKPYYTTNKIGYGAYTLEPGTRPVGNWTNNNRYEGNSNESQGSYTVTKNPDDNTITVNVPMYTRERKMVTASDFTGTNPYWAYYRYAVVKVTLWDKAGKQVPFRNPTTQQEEKERIVPILQVPRIENPTAIYRKHDNDAEFEVALKVVSGATMTSFEDLFSITGPWRASIMADPDGLIKLTKDGQEVTNSSTDKFIEGATGSQVVFTYKPRGTIGANETRCGIIKVEYEGYNCNHLIFVRQGYDKGVQLGDANWSCYQVYATGGATNTNETQPELETVNVKVTKSPLSIGSMLKRCQYDNSIREWNDGNGCGWLDGVEGKNLSVAYLNGTTVAIKNAKWGSIKGSAWIDNSFLSETSTDRYRAAWAETWKNVDNTAKDLAVPTAENYQSLMDNCQFGFGVAYADGATKTAVIREDAYSYTDYNNNGETSHKGVRVCIAYSRSSGNNILFPLGSTGQGRRAIQVFSNRYVALEPAQAKMPTSTKNPGAGSLTYGKMATLLYGTTNAKRPLTYNLYRSPGAIYWIRKPKMNGTTPQYASWDMNYYTSMFNQYDESSIANNTGEVQASGSSDALPIKLIYK